MLDDKSAWSGLFCFAILRDPGKEELQNTEHPTRPGSFRPRGVMTPAPTVDHAHPNHDIVVLQSDFSEWCYREFPVWDVLMISAHLICEDFVIAESLG